MNGLKVAVIDSASFYGGPSISLKPRDLVGFQSEFVSFVSVKLRNDSSSLSIIDTSNEWDNQGYLQSNKLIGCIDLDIMPQCMHSDSDLVKAIIKTKIYHYLELHSLQNLKYAYKEAKKENDYPHEKDSFINVPCSKEDIFENSSLSLFDKRILMKTINSLLSFSEKQGIYKPK